MQTPEEVQAAANAEAARQARSFLRPTAPPRLYSSTPVIQAAYISSTRKTSATEGSTVRQAAVAAEAAAKAAMAAGGGGAEAAAAAAAAAKAAADAAAGGGMAPPPEKESSSMPTWLDDNVTIEDLSSRYGAARCAGALRLTRVPVNGPFLLLVFLKEM